MKLYKRIIVLLLLSCAFLMLSVPVYASTPEEWYTVKGTYAKDNNNQYNCTTLSLMYLDNDVVMFEFFMMKGSESKESTNNFCLPGAFYLDENGIGIYEHPKTENVLITFELTDNKVIVNQSGNFPLDLRGEYSFIKSNIKVTEEAAKEILEQLPTAATSLNHNNGEYKLSMSNEMVDGWFYDVKATFVDTNKLLARFYIASDMSAVYRVDTDEPVLIWGSAQPMLEATYFANSDSFLGETLVENQSNINYEEKDKTPIEMNYVSITPQKYSIALKDSVSTVIDVPGNLKYTLTCKSSDPSIAEVDEKGVVTALVDGETTISGTIIIDGAQKPFEFTVSCFDEKATMDDTKSTLETYILWISIFIIIAILFVTSIIFKNRKRQLKDEL